MSPQKEPTGPRMSSVIIIGVLTFILGKMLGLASLVTQPVIVVNKEPNPENVVPGTVYYQKGTSSGRTVWRAKEEAWREGTVSVLSLSETELNQWGRDRFKKTSSAPSEEEGFMDRVQLHVSAVNFRILEDEVQMASEVRIGDLFGERTFIYQVRGHFESTSDGVKFVHEKGTLGSAPLGHFPVYGDVLFSLVSGSLEETPEMEWLPESLASLESIEIEGGQLILRRRAQG
ncbi:MAG: hypothetical protein AB3N64_02540 [Puniceicoccaceae bacterium]